MSLENAVSDVAYGASCTSSKFVGIAPIPSGSDRGDRDTSFAVSTESLSQKGAELSTVEVSPILNIIDELL